MLQSPERGPDLLESPARRTLAGGSLRIGLLVDLAPRKQGSFEDWIIAMAREASRRNHRLDVFCAEPVHPAIARDLSRAGSRWTSLDSLLGQPFATIRQLQQYHVLHLNMLGTRHPITLMAYSAWPARILYVDHASELTRRRGVLKAFKGRVLDLLQAPRIAKVVGVSEFVRERARTEMHLRRSKVTTIYNGVNLDRFGADRSRPAESGFQVACVANLIPAKSVHTLLEALASLNLPHCRLMVIGDGPEQPRLERMTRDLGLDRQVAFLGLRDDVPTLLRQCHAFVHPATWPEAFGLTITEAMASGCPVVASRVGAVSELIEDGVSGLLVPPGDVKALGAALRLLYYDPRLAGTLAANARRRVQTCFSLERCVREHLDLSEHVARKPEKRTAARSRTDLGWANPQPLSRAERSRARTE
jgi:glycosyltransferase involved in cell wall biosynthesis